jgi:hypothetical protein
VVQDLVDTSLIPAAPQGNVLVMLEAEAWDKVIGAHNHGVGHPASQAPSNLDNIVLCRTIALSGAMHGVSGRSSE